MMLLQKEIKMAICCVFQQQQDERCKLLFNAECRNVYTYLLFITFSYNLEKHVLYHVHVVPE